MDRVNRSRIVVAPWIAIPLAFAMTTLSTGDDSTVRGKSPSKSHPASQVSRAPAADSSAVNQAIALDANQTGAVQQVAGKQVTSRKTKPGLFQALANRNTGSGNTSGEQASSPSPQQGRGLLSAILDGRSSGNKNQNQSRPQSQNRTSQNRTAQNRTAQNRTAQNRSRSNQSSNQSSSQTSRPANSSNWDGVPYHSVNNTKPQTSNQPLRNPAPGESSNGPTRIIRGGSSSGTPTLAASSRRPAGPTPARSPAPALAIPTPPADLEPLPAPTSSLSRQTSSRRSNRRDLQPLDASEIAAASKLSPLSTPADTGLVPRVRRKQVAAATPPAAKPEATTPKPSVAPESTAVAATPAATTPTPAATTPTPAPSATSPAPAAAVAQKPITTPSTPSTSVAAPSQPERALAAIGTPEAVAMPTPAPSASVPGSTASAPRASNPMPTQPYAGTPSLAVPSLSASHRSGPPASAFQPTQPESTQHGFKQPEFKPTAAPIGSGIASNSEVASFRSQPTMPTNDPSLGAYTVPQGQPGTSSQGRMTTFGQPVTPPAEATANRNVPNGQAASPAVPNTIAPNTIAPNTAAPNAAVSTPPNVPATAPLAADNFGRSDYGGRNQMRENGGATGPTNATTTSELPGIRVLTYGPETMMLRQTGQYEIRVENRGSIDATGVMVRATVPQWAELRSRNSSRGSIENEKQGSVEHLVWQIDQLPAGSSEQMFIRLTASKSGTFNLDVDWTLIPQKSITQIKVHEPKLKLTIEGPDEVVYGKSQTYKVRVLNPGDGTAPNVVFTLSPNSATPQTQRIGDIPPGKEAQFDVELTAQDLGDLQIHGLASGDLDLRSEAIKTIAVAAARLEAILSGPELKYQNTDAVYNLQVQNTGAAASEKVVATLRLPNGVKYLGGMENATLQGNILKWEITSLPAGASRDYQFQCTMTSTGEHLFAFDCSGTAAGNASVSLATRVESIADLVLTVSDPPAPAPIGSEVTYEIVVRNRGSKEATDVKAIAQFSHGIEPQRIEGAKGELVTGQVLFDTIPRIGAGQEIRMRVIAKADRGGHHRFRTEVRSGDTVLVAEEATHYMSPQSDRVSRRSSEDASR